MFQKIKGIINKEKIQKLILLSAPEKCSEQTKDDPKYKDVPIKHLKLF